MDTSPVTVEILQQELRALRETIEKVAPPHMLPEYRLRESQIRRELIALKYPNAKKG